ncbi:hypothetical protein B7494_g2635 [Chlorociboria aeruginascens]|nr:hypothetical protein B7494_g2635 [Chlorociboria aeruginascens]
MKLRPLQSDSHHTIPALRRRSSWLQHILGSYYDSQSPLEQRPAEFNTLQPVGVTSIRVGQPQNLIVFHKFRNRHLPDSSRPMRKTPKTSPPDEEKLENVRQYGTTKKGPKPKPSHLSYSEAELQSSATTKLQLTQFLRQTHGSPSKSPKMVSLNNPILNDLQILMTS